MQFSKANYQEHLQLKALQQSQRSTATAAHDSTTCISKSGASDHITDNGSLFSFIFVPKFPHFIILADGSKVAAKGIGHASPTPSQSLDFVLFILSCPFNIICFSLLTHKLNCSITFDVDSFITQKHGMGWMISREHESPNLY
ncbi:hypothetical protein CR513_15515, partial [Mucuna pruriens]